jgi:hypothetical protein
MSDLNRINRKNFNHEILIFEVYVIIYIYKFIYIYIYIYINLYINI